MTSASGPLRIHPDRNLGMELVRATEAAAIRSFPFVGRGDKNGADGAAVDAMRAFLNTVDFSGTIVIGEGEKDNAPMLFNGEVVGTGDGPSCDIAVDPIDGTSLTSAGRQNAISVIAASDRGTMLDASSVFYMDKLVTGFEGVGIVDIRQSIAENIRALAAAKGKPVGEMVIAVLDRPRHEGIIQEIRDAGAGTRLLLDGDVAGGINAAREEARRLGQPHPALPAPVHESPTVTLKLLPQCDAVAGVSVTMAIEALRHGDIVALPWQRAPWASIHPGIITLRNRALGAAEQAYLELMRAADQKAEQEALAWCEAQGVPSGCG
jgi:hypothetical protein